MRKVYDNQWIIDALKGVPVKDTKDKVVETNDEGNRRREFTCGCIVTTGAGAYSTPGSAWVYEYCPQHKA